MDGYPVRDDPDVTALITHARDGDRQAWEGIVERYAPLIWSVCRKQRLDRADAEDVAQTVWLHLVDHLGNLRDPAALPGWLATTTRRECLRVLRAAQRTAAGTGSGPALDTENLPDVAGEAADHGLLLAERNAALRAAFRDLPPDCQRLIGMLIADPPLSYAEISAALGIRIGSIGPSRSRCLDKIRRHPAVAALLNAQAA
jgi:RNA polymerase sigma factor (sigma-70 family)